MMKCIGIFTVLLLWGGGGLCNATPTSFSGGTRNGDTNGGCDRTLCQELMNRSSSNSSSSSPPPQSHHPHLLLPPAWSSLFDPLANLDALRHTLTEALTTLRDLHSLPSCPLSVSPHATLNLTLATEWSLSQLLSSHSAMWEHSVLNSSSPWVTPTCKLNVLNTIHCGQCHDASLKPPCTCGETLSSCLLVPARLVGDAWKHAISSVRTGLRLISTQIIAASSTTTVCNGVTSTIERLTNNLNSWREPFSAVARATCDLNQHTATAVGHQGNSRKHVKDSSSSSSCSSGNEAAAAAGEDDVGLLEFRSLLVNVTKTLERFWPQVGGLPDSSHSHSSSSLSHHGSHTPDIQSEEGYSSLEEEEEEYDDDEDWGASGDDHEDHEDDDLVPSNHNHNPQGEGSGSFNKGQPTDDEDLLLLPGASSGDGPDDDAIHPPKGPPPPLGKDFDFSNPSTTSTPTSTSKPVVVVTPPKKPPASSSSCCLVPLSPLVLVVVVKLLLLGN